MFLSDGAINFLLYALFGLSTDELSNGFATFEDNERGNAHHVELTWGFRVLIYVYFYNLHLAFIFRSQLVYDRPHHLARSAPRSPKVHKHRDGGI